MIKQKINGKMLVRTAEKTFTEMLDMPGLEAIIFNKKTKKDVKGNAKIKTLRKKFQVVI